MDLTGQIYGNLTVLEDTGNRFHRSIVWRCLCTCGTERDVPALYLRSGAVTNCGSRQCKQRKPRKPQKIQDLTGQVFGELTAVKPTEVRYFGSVVWECTCSCGKTCFVPTLMLHNGDKKSCGHIRYDDLRGLRFSRLVAIRPLSQKSHLKKWLCRCDCGVASIVAAVDLKSGNTKSCGCISKKGGTTYAKCPSCGDRYPIVLDGSKTPQFCPDCTPKYFGKNWKVCPICRDLFQDPPSNNRVACSKECSDKWRSIIHAGISNKWNLIARKRWSERGQTENLKKGHSAAQQSPISGRFETNREAKIWILIDPSGNEHVVRNLINWAREHTELFDKPPGDKSAAQIAAGFRAIAQTLKGKRKTPAMHYWGWTLKGPPTPPPD